MNDDELELRLRDEIQRRIDPPAHAPIELRRAIEETLAEEPVQPARRSGLRRQRLGALGGLAAAASIAALVAAGLMFRSTPSTGTASLPAAIETFSRIDARTAWAVSGSDLYITRDAGVSWTHGRLPGGRGMDAMAATTAPAVLATPQPCGSAAGAAVDCSGATAGMSTGVFPDHMYPYFVDGAHGWLVSWTRSNKDDYVHSSYALTVHRTSDGGQTWTSSPVPGVFRGLGVVRFTDTLHGALVAYAMDVITSSASSTIEGGTITPPPAEPQPGDSGDAQPTIGPVRTPVDPGATVLLTTSDGGATWVSRGSLPDITLVAPVSATEFWALPGPESRTGGSSFRLLHSTDGAASWTSAQISLDANCTAYFAGNFVPKRSGDALELTVPCLMTNLYSLPADATPAPGSTADGSAGFTETPGLMRSRAVTIRSRDAGRTWQVASTHDVVGTATYSPTVLFSGHQIPQPLLTMNSGPNGQTEISASFDGGATWRPLSTQGLPGYPYSIEYVTPDDVWVEVINPARGGNMVTGGVYATRDGGRTWRAIAGPAWPVTTEATPMTPTMPIASVPNDITPKPTTQPSVSPSTSAGVISSFGAIDAKTAWLVRGGALLITEDGGATWRRQQSLPVDAGSAIDAFDANHVATLNLSDAQVGPSDASTASWVMLATTNGSDLAKQGLDVDLPGTMTGYFASVHYVTATRAVAQVEADWADTKSNAGRTCVRWETSDAGKTWFAAPNATCVGEVRWATRTLGYSTSAGDQRLDVTRDGGSTWAAGTLAVADGAIASKGWVAGLDATADGTLWAVAVWAASSGQATIVASESSADGGKTWKIEHVTRHDLGVAVSLSTTGPGRWIAMDGNVELSVSDDFGATWKKLAATGLSGQAHGLVFVSPQAGWAVTDSPGDAQESFVFTSKDGGLTWTKLTIGAPKQ